MKRTARRVALTFLGLVCLLLAIPVALTWRQVRQERLNRSLIAAVKRNDDRTVVSLLDQGADVNCRQEPHPTPSLWETLVDALRGMSSQRYRAETPLTLAAADDQNATVQLLLAHGANVNVQKIGDHTYAPLVQAVSNYNLEFYVIADMLDHGADVNQRNGEGETALVAAVVAGRINVVRLLIARHVDVNLPGVWLQKEDTPLAHALQGTDFEADQIVRMLKVAGAKQ